MKSSARARLLKRVPWQARYAAPAFFFPCENREFSGSGARDEVQLDPLPMILDLFAASCLVT